MYTGNKQKMILVEKSEEVKHMMYVIGKVLC